jgi:hypothetical protein
VLYGYETWYLTLREEHRLSMEHKRERERESKNAYKVFVGKPEETIKKT